MATLWIFPATWVSSYRCVNVRHFPTFVSGNGAADGCDITEGKFATALIKFTDNQPIFIAENVLDFNNMLQIVHQERKSFVTLKSLAAAEPDCVLPYTPKPVAVTAQAAAGVSVDGIIDLEDDMV